MAKKNKSGMAILLAVLLVIVIVLIIVLVITINKGKKLKEEGGYDISTVQDDELNGMDIAKVTIVNKGENEENFDPYEKNIDFVKLKEINPDVFAWIYVPGADIDCAVVTDNDDPEYYLGNGIEGLDGVFMQSYNKKDFSDRMSVIYGKKNENGVSVFEGLFKFQDADFYKEHKYIYVYTPDDVKKYRIFAAHRAVANHLMLGYDWAVDSIYLDYLIEVLESRQMGDNIDKDVEITVEDKVLTLSERVKDDDEVRFLVQGVLEK